MYANTSVYCNTVALLLFICHKNAIEKPREICMETGSTSSATKVIAMYTRERGSPEANSGLSTSNLLLSYLILSVVDLGRSPSSPVPGYRLGSRESVRLGRFH